MKIGFVYERFDARSGSFGAHGYFLATELVRRGHELWGPGLPDMPGMVSLPGNKWGKLRMVRNVDVLYIRVNVLHWANRCTWLRLVRPSCPVVWEINGATEEILSDRPRHPDAVRLCERDVRSKRRMAPLVDAAVCMSEWLARYARERYGIRRAVVAPNGGDLAAYMPEGGGTLLGELKDRFIVLWAGSAEQQMQGIHDILEAARECETTAPDVLFVLLLGGKGSATALPHYRNTLLLAGMDRLQVQRYLADAHCVAVIYRRCDVGDVPAWGRHPEIYEPGYVLKLLEAMAARKAVIASNMGSIPRVVRDGVDGLLVGEGPGELVSAILRLRKDPALRDRLATAARERIRSRYTWQHTVDCIEPLLFELVGGRAASVPVSVGPPQLGAGL